MDWAGGVGAHLIDIENFFDEKNAQEKEAKLNAIGTFKSVQFELVSQSRIRIRDGLDNKIVKNVTSDIQDFRPQVVAILISFQRNKDTSQSLHEVGVYCVYKYTYPSPKRTWIKKVRPDINLNFVEPPLLSKTFLK